MAVNCDSAVSLAASILMFPRAASAFLQRGQQILLDHAGRAAGTLLRIAGVAVDVGADVQRTNGHARAGRRGWGSVDGDLGRDLARVDPVAAESLAERIAHRDPWAGGPIGRGLRRVGSLQ